WELSHDLVRSPSFGRPSGTRSALPSMPSPRVLFSVEIETTCFSREGSTAQKVNAQSTLVHRYEALWRCDQSRTLGIQTRTAHVLRNRSVAEVEQNMRLRAFCRVCSAA